MPQVDRFTAWCACPACGRFACHLLRAGTVKDNHLQPPVRPVSWTSTSGQRGAQYRSADIAQASLDMLFGDVRISFDTTQEITEADAKDALTGVRYTYASLAALQSALRRDAPHWSDEARAKQAEFKLRKQAAMEARYEVVRTCVCGTSWGQT